MIVNDYLHGHPDKWYSHLMTHDSITTGAPLYRRIADTLASAMARGDYPVASRLPPEFALMRMFDASRFTIREALADLRARGLVASRRGSGTMVLRQAPQAPEFTAISRSIDEFLATPIPLQPLEIRDVIADEALAAELHCESGRQFLLFRGIRRSSAGPVLTLSDVYIAASFSAIRPHLSGLTGSIAGTAERMFGIRVRNIVEELEPIVHDRETAAVFDALEGSPAMLVRRWYYLDGGTILLISRSIYPPGRVLFRNELRRSEVLVTDS
jgi:DNA-binding GntR family transcriptional regulator